MARTLDDPAQRAHLIREAGRRFRIVGWIGLSFIVLSGIGNLLLHPWFLAYPLFHAKLALVALVLALSVLHDFILGPRARITPTPALRGWASWLGRATMLLGVVVVFLGLAFRG